MNQSTIMEHYGHQRLIRKRPSKESLGHIASTTFPADQDKDSLVKGMVILSLCAIYTIVLFSCVAVIKTLAILLMGQPLSIKTIEFKKQETEQDLKKFDRNFNQFLQEDPVARFIIDSKH